jgi:hypothetical protein
VLLYGKTIFKLFVKKQEVSEEVLWVREKVLLMRKVFKSVIFNGIIQLCQFFSKT